MQTLNIGENLRWQRRDTASIEEGRRDYQGASPRDEGIVRSAMKMKLQLTKNVNTTVATITTPTYSSGVAGLNGVNNDSPSSQRWLEQTLNIGGSLRWLSRHIALEIGKVLETTKGQLIRVDGIVRSVINMKLQLTKGVMIVFAAMIIFGVNLYCAIRQRCLMQTLNIGRTLKWQCRGTSLVIGKAVETTKGHLSVGRWWHSPTCNECVSCS